MSDYPIEITSISFAAIVQSFKMHPFISVGFHNVRNVKNIGNHLSGGNMIFVHVTY